MDNKYGIEIPRELVIQYYDQLKSEFYKILPIYEGIDPKTKKVIRSPEEAHEAYLLYLKNFIIDIGGGYSFFMKSDYFMKLIIRLEGMLSIPANNKEQVKKLVFSSMDICEKLKKGVSSDELQIL